MINISFLKEIRVDKTVEGNHSLVIYDKKAKAELMRVENFNESVIIKRSYYTDLMFYVLDRDNNKMNPFKMDEFKTVFIELHSQALGDQVAWLPIVDLFQKKHKCKVIVSCKHYKLFKQFYPNMKFCFGGDYPTNISAVYILGYSVSGFKDKHNNTISPVDCRTVSLQNVACHILGIEPQEVNPNFKSKGKPIYKDNYIVFTAVAQGTMKLWNNPEALTEMVVYFQSKGYKVIEVGMTDDTKEIKAWRKRHNIIDKTGQLEWSKLLNIIEHGKLFLGMSSGLSWLAWALGQKVVTINGVTADNVEFKHTKIQNKDVCNGCFNDTSLVYDNSAEYCPRNKDFECTRKITSEMVIKEIERKNLI